MNRPNMEPPDRQSPDDALFERLVDGELKPDEYRELLDSLDDEPGGWRRCALAFLESQAVSQEFAGWMQDVTSAKSGSPEPTFRARAAAGDSFPRRWLNLAVAASAACVLAFGLGIAVRGWWPASDVIVPPDEQIAGHQHNTLTGSSIPSQSETGTSLPASSRRHVRLVVNGREIELPVESWTSNADNRFGRRPRSRIPDDVVQALERLGHHIQRSQNYVPLQSLDGDPLMVPVEDVRIVPVSNRVFQ